MKKTIALLCLFQLLMTLFLGAIPISAESLQNNNLITVKLSAYLGNQTGIEVSVTGDYFISTDDKNINGKYTIKAEAGDLVLYQNGKKVKNYGATMTLAPNPL